MISERIVPRFLLRMRFRRGQMRRDRVNRLRLARFGTRAVFVAVLLFALWGLAGCGSTSTRAKLHSGFPHPPDSYRPLAPGEGVYERVDGHLREADMYGLVLVSVETAGDGRIAIVAKRRGLTRQHVELEYNMEEPAKYGPKGKMHRLVSAGGGGGFNLNSPYEGVLSSESTGGCLAGHQVVFAYGELLKPQDTVVARAAGLTMRVTRVPIPRRLHPRGVLVYTVLPGGPKYVIVVKAPSGHIVYREPLDSLSKDAPCRAS
jgi:hypothetical protein